MTEPSIGDIDESPSRRPTASEEVITELAPDCRISGTFSCSRTEATIQASGLSWRTVRVTSTLESSRSVVMMTWVAFSTPAWRSTPRRVASPAMTTSWSRLPSATATGLGSTTTIASRT